MNLFTCDIDWAPEDVIADTIEIFNRFNVKCTFFCTHKSQLLDSIKENKNFELAIHPNYNKILMNGEGNQSQVLKEILDIYPMAKGVRSHSLTHNSYLHIEYKKLGLIYESNIFLPYWDNIKIYNTWNDLIIIPFNFEDDIHFLSKKNFNEVNLNLFGNKLNVFDFHPIHIFLNTDCTKTYENAKENYHNAGELIKLRNSNVFGTRDFLIKLLKNHYKHFNSSFTLSEYLQKWCNT